MNTHTHTRTCIQRRMRFFDFFSLLLTLNPVTPSSDRKSTGLKKLWSKKNWTSQGKITIMFPAVFLLYFHTRAHTYTSWQNGYWRTNIRLAQKSFLKVSTLFVSRTLIPLLRVQLAEMPNIYSFTNELFQLYHENRPSYNVLTHR